MRDSADDWLKTLLNGVLIGSILFLTGLPALGWAWHRVLPEHMHAFVGVAHSGDDEILPASTSPDVTPSLCANCTGSQIGAGVVHLPGNSGLQVLGMAVELGALMFVFVLPVFSDRIMNSRVFYLSPTLLPPDPPPNRGELVV